MMCKLRIKSKIHDGTIDFDVRGAARVRSYRLGSGQLANLVS